MLCALVGVVALIGIYKRKVRHAIPVADMAVVRSPEQIARGERLAELCVRCHSSSRQLPLGGGTQNLVGRLGTLVGPNLTPAGPLKDWSDGEIVRAIREGIDQRGRALLIMPTENFRHLSDDDVQALAAYLRTQPPSDRQTPDNGMNLVGTVLLGAGIFPTSAQLPLAAPVANPPPAWCRTTGGTWWISQAAVPAMASISPAATGAALRRLVQISQPFSPTGAPSSSLQRFGRASIPAGMRSTR